MVKPRGTQKVDLFNTTGVLYIDGSTEQNVLRATNKYDNSYNSQHATSCENR